jgi:iron complex outermembrane receptor protein
MKVLAVLIMYFFQVEFASSQTSIDTVYIPEIEIIAKRKLEETGLKITRPDSLSLKRGMTFTLSELLSGNTPVFIRSYGLGSQATANFRGSAASHTQMYWNGTRLNSPSRGYADLSLLPVFFVDDLFLLHGGSSLSEGTGALGGSIHLQNMPDWDTRNRFTVAYEHSAFHTRKGMAKVQAGIGNMRSVSRVMVDLSENDFPFYNVGVIPFRKDTLKNAGYKKTAVMQEFYFRRKSTQIAAFRFWYQKSNRNLPALMSYQGAPREENQNDNQIRGQLELKRYFGDGNLEFSAGFAHTNMEYFRRTTNPVYVNESSQSSERIYTNRLKYSRSPSRIFSYNALLEANYYHVDARDRLKETGYDHSRKEASLLVGAHWKPTLLTAMFFSSGTELYDGKNVAFIPSAGFEWQVAPRLPLVLKLNLARNYHKPGLNDLYWIPGGNPGLKSEDGTTGDIALVSSFSRKDLTFRHEISAYYSEIRNWIIWQPSQAGAWYWEATNLEKVVSRGFEYDFRAEWKRRHLKTVISGNYALTLVSNREEVVSVDQTRNKQLIYIPKNIANLHATTGYKNWSVNVDVAYTGRRYTQSNNSWTLYESVLNPYWLTNVSVQKTIRLYGIEANIKLKADNLFNINYQQVLWRPMPGRFYSVVLAAGSGR